MITLVSKIGERNSQKILGSLISRYTVAHKAPRLLRTLVRPMSIFFGSRTAKLSRLVTSAKACRERQHQYLTTGHGKRSHQRPRPQSGANHDPTALTQWPHSPVRARSRGLSEPRRPPVICTKITAPVAHRHGRSGCDDQRGHVEGHWMEHYVASGVRHLTPYTYV